ncbi:hypothetical protein F3J24_04485 [Comamonas sp. Tr-654]|uniref:hypothetical protein n=1 Tax=Comamonas sp. Tr-654 TaxID=2608341 RepID=UPI001421B5D8|nr:hypothetical protein [Comamonas sp. Tr-654]NIF82767.1 hypothetical protein [Comamonas sp. Tr-654]
MNMHPETPPGDDKPDALRELYHEAVAEDRGPSAQSSAAILERARQRAAGVGQQPPELADKTAANDRFWLRHALGGLAAVGLVGWLMLQHAAWRGGPDAGPGSSSEVAAEPAQPADIDPAAQASAPAPAIASAGAAADASAAGSASRAEKSRQSRAPAKAQQASPSLDGQASAPAPQSEAAQASGASTGKDMARSARPAPRASAPQRDAVAAQSSITGVPLPLCPLQTEKESLEQAAKEAEGIASGAPANPLHCRPRKPEQLPPANAESGQGAAEDVAKPQR